MLVGSFLPFYKFQIFGGSLSFNAWDHGVFMIRTLPALLGMFMALQVALQAFSNIDMPNRLLGLTWDQFHLVLGLQAALLMFTFFVQAKAPFKFGTGFWIMALATIALLVGSLMRVASAGRRPRLL